MGPVGIKKIVRENFKIATVSSQGGDFAPIPVYKVAIKKIKYMPRPPDHSQKNISRSRQIKKAPKGLCLCYISRLQF